MKATLRYLSYAACGVALGSALSAACSADDSGAGHGAGAGGTPASGGSDASTGATGGAGGSGGGSGGTDSGSGGGINLDGSFTDGNVDPDAACDLQTYQATITKKPVDIIFVVDNSCSMSEEIAGVQNNIYSNFAQIISQSGLDYRVIVIGEHGPNIDQSICIGPPLGGKPCSPEPAADTPPSINPPVFYHYDNNDIESWDSTCKMLTWYDKPDRYGLAKNGWKEWLRTEAYKTFVEITDDRMNCTNPVPPSTYFGSCSTNGPGCYNDTSQPQVAAQQFDADLLAKDPTQFGTAQDRNYVWHSFTAVAANPNSTTGVFEPNEPIGSGTCPGGVNNGPGYQALSILTGGLRYPVCNGTGYDVVFKKIAEGVIKGAKIQCDFPFPAPPAGKELDPETVQIEYTPSNGAPKQKFTHVDSAAQCQAGSFYYEWGPDSGPDAGSDKIVLCPDTCKVVQGDDQAGIQILALCKQGPSK